MTVPAPRMIAWSFSKTTFVPVQRDEDCVLEGPAKESQHACLAAARERGPSSCQCAANLSANPLSRKDRGNKTGQFGWVAETPHSLLVRLAVDRAACLGSLGGSRKAHDQLGRTLLRLLLQLLMLLSCCCKLVQPVPTTWGAQRFSTQRHMPAGGMRWVAGWQADGVLSAPPA